MEYSAPGSLFTFPEDALRFILVNHPQKDSVDTESLPCLKKILSTYEEVRGLSGSREGQDWSPNYHTLEKQLSIHNASAELHRRVIRNTLKERNPSAKRRYNELLCYFVSKSGADKSVTKMVESKLEEDPEEEEEETESIAVEDAVEYYQSCASLVSVPVDTDFMEAVQAFQDGNSEGVSLVSSSIHRYEEEKQDYVPLDPTPSTVFTADHCTSLSNKRVMITLFGFLEGFGRQLTSLSLSSASLCNASTRVLLALCIAHLPALSHLNLTDNEEITDDIMPEVVLFPEEKPNLLYFLLQNTSLGYDTVERVELYTRRNRTFFLQNSAMST